MHAVVVNVTIDDRAAAESELRDQLVPFQSGARLGGDQAEDPDCAEGAHAVVKVSAESRLTRTAGVMLPFVAVPAGLLVRQARSTRGGAVVERRGRRLPVYV